MPLLPRSLQLKPTSTLDQVSGVRFVLGVGVGRREDDFSVTGVGYRDRGRRWDQALELMHAAWGASWCPGRRGRSARARRTATRFPWCSAALRSRLRGGPARHPADEPARAGRHGPREDGGAGHAHGPAVRVDRARAPPDPARPADLRRAPSALRAVRPERRLPVVHGEVQRVPPPARQEAAPAAGEEVAGAG